MAPKNNIKECPCKQFILDVCEFIGKCRHKQKCTVMFTDANDHVNNSPLADALAELDIREGVTSHHPELTPPATYA